MNRLERMQRYEALGDIECLCCQINRLLGVFKPTGLPSERHHLNAGEKAGGKKLGDEFTIPICSWHHRGSWTSAAAPGGYRGMLWMEAKALEYGPSWAQSAPRFHAEYPTDAELLETTNALVAKIIERQSLITPEPQ